MSKYLGVAVSGVTISAKGVMIWPLTGAHSAPRAADGTTIVIHITSNPGKDRFITNTLIRFVRVHPVLIHAVELVGNLRKLFY